jgi:hypothetical protein
MKRIKLVEILIKQIIFMVLKKPNLSARCPNTWTPAMRIKKDSLFLKVRKSIEPSLKSINFAERG